MPRNLYLIARTEKRMRPARHPLSCEKIKAASKLGLCHWKGVTDDVLVLVCLVSRRALHHACLSISYFCRLSVVTALTFAACTVYDQMRRVSYRSRPSLRYVLGQIGVVPSCLCRLRRDCFVRVSKSTRSSLLEGSELIVYFVLKTNPQFLMYSFSSITVLLYRVGLSLSQRSGFRKSLLYSTKI
jgi:hypothetical protein